MTNTIKAHNHHFVITGEGFPRNAEGDFDLICTRIEAAIKALPAGEVRDFHFASSAADQGRPASFDKFDELCDREALTVIRGWHNPNHPVFVSISAA